MDAPDIGLPGLGARVVRGVVASYNDTTKRAVIDPIVGQGARLSDVRVLFLYANPTRMGVGRPVVVLVLDDGMAWVIGDVA